SYETGWVMTVPRDDPWSLEAEEKRQIHKFTKHFTPVVLAVLEALLTRYSLQIGELGPTLLFAANIAHAARLQRGLAAILPAVAGEVWIRQYHSRIAVPYAGERGPPSWSCFVRNSCGGLAPAKCRY